MPPGMLHNSSKVKFRLQCELHILIFSQVIFFISQFPNFQVLYGIDFTSACFNDSVIFDGGHWISHHEKKKQRDTADNVNVKAWVLAWLNFLTFTLCILIKLYPTWLVGQLVLGLGIHSPSYDSWTRCTKDYDSRWHLLTDWRIEVTTQNMKMWQWATMCRCFSRQFGGIIKIFQFSTRNLWWVFNPKRDKCQTV